MYIFYWRFVFWDCQTLGYLIGAVPVNVNFVYFCIRIESNRLGAIKDNSKGTICWISGLDIIKDTLCIEMTILKKTQNDIVSIESCIYTYPAYQVVIYYKSQILAIVLQ